MSLSLIRSEPFGSVRCDFYKDNSDIWMTRKQIGEALEYSDPQKAIDNLHAKHKSRLDKFSVTHKVRGTDGKVYFTILYSAKGVYEICRWAQQPKADIFFDWVYERLEALRKGEVILVRPQSEETRLIIQKQRAEAMLLNARTRQAKLILDMQKNKTLSPVAVELLGINALEKIIDQPIAYRPEIGKTYTTTEIADELDISPITLGKIATANGLKTHEYGIEVLDKSPYSSKQVTSFRYNENGRTKLFELIRKGLKHD